jgi:hypothetical protein
VKTPADTEFDLSSRRAEGPPSPSPPLEGGGSDVLHTPARPPSSCSRLRAGRAGCVLRSRAGLGSAVVVQRALRCCSSSTPGMSLACPLASRWIAPSGSSSTGDAVWARQTLTEFEGRGLGTGRGHPQRRGPVGGPRERSWLCSRVRGARLQR